MRAAAEAGVSKRTIMGKTFADILEWRKTKAS